MNYYNENHRKLFPYKCKVPELPEKVWVKKKTRVQYLSYLLNRSTIL